MDVPVESRDMATKDVTDLLISWNLPQYCERFKEEEVCINALKVLTEANIRELIPKVGPRALFHFEWQRWKTEIQNSAYAAGGGSVQSPGHNHNHDMSAIPIICKVEGYTHMDQLHEDMTMNSIGHDEHSSPATSNGENGSSELLDNQKNASSMQLCNDLEKYGNEIPNVKSILENTAEGRKVIEFYTSYRYLDTNHRRRLVKMIISVVLEHRLRATHSLFQGLTQQIVQIFPTEPRDVYYIPRHGHVCPRGALYNKHLNMGRSWRKRLR